MAARPRFHSDAPDDVAPAAGSGAPLSFTGASRLSDGGQSHPPDHTGADELIAPPRYGLRALLLAVTAASVLFALLRTIDAGLSAALILLLVMIAAHVAATALGTKSRDRTPRTRQASQPLAHEGAASTVPPTMADVAAAAAPGTQLGHHAVLGWAMILLSALGGITGALAGGWMLASHYSGRLGPLALGFGTLSSGVLGGFVGFFVCSCLGVFLRALGEAATPAPRGRD